MKKNIFFTLIALFLITTIYSCNGEEPIQSKETEDVTADINNATTWKSNKVYLIKNTDLQLRATLTIEAGAVIKFVGKGNITVRDGAKILAQGTSSAPIVFTSYKDDANGGDSDGVVDSPSQGDWGTITLLNSKGSVFNYCKFNYGGFSNSLSQNPTLNVSTGSNAEITSCTFYKNGGGKEGDSFIGALDCTSTSADVIITNNKFQDNIIPLSIRAEKNLDNSNSFTGNKYQGIFVIGSAIESKSISWLETEVAFVIATTNTFTVSSGKTLTLGNGVVLKFMQNGRMELQDGESALKNYNGKDVYFTTIKDDRYGGDSNGNNSEILNESYYWDGILLKSQKKTTNENFAPWDNILYANPNPIL